MILRGLKVEGFRCFADPVEIGGLSERIHVVHAPNGTGKSTLFEALRVAIFERARSRKESVKSLRPWGRELAPAVAVEFAHGGEEYRLTKRFLDSPATELLRKEEGRFVRFAQGDAADERVRAFFTRSPFSRGGEEIPGLSSALWAPQGRLDLGSLPDEVGQFLRESLGVQVAAPGSDRIRAAIEKAWSEYFTETGRHRGGKDAPAIVRLDAERARLMEERREALERRSSLDESRRLVEELGFTAAQAKREEEARTADLEKARTEAREYAALLAERDLFGARAGQARADWKALRDRVEAIGKVGREQRAAAEASSRLADDLAAAKRERVAREAVVAAASDRLLRAREGRAAVEAFRSEVERAERFVRARAEAARAEGHAERIRGAEEDLARATAERAAHPGPEPEAIEALRDAIRGREELRVRLAAASIRLRIELVRGGSMEVTAGEDPGTREIGAGEATEVVGDPAAGVEIPGVAKIEARGPSGDFEELREKLREAEGRIRARAESLGSEDPAVLQTRREKAARLESRVAEAAARLEAISEGTDSETLTESAARARTIEHGILEEHPDWADDPPDPESLREDLADGDREASQAVEAAEAARDRATEDLRRAKDHETRLGTELEAARRREIDLAGRREELEDDDLEAGERTARLTELAMTRDAANEKLAAAERKIEASGEDPRERAEKLESAVAACRTRAGEARVKEREEARRLEDLAEGGAYSKLARIEERLAELDSRVAEERARREAISLLRETVVACRAETLDAVAAPVAAAATRKFERIAGPRLGTVRLEESLAPRGVVPEIAGSEVSGKELSGGEREQLHLAVRLALAERIATEERQLVVLDDILTATDAGRLARVLTLLEEAADRLQIVILTCHPERYGGLEEAGWTDLRARREG